MSYQYFNIVNKKSLLLNGPKKGEAYILMNTSVYLANKILINKNDFKNSSTQLMNRTDTVSVIVQCALRSKGLLMELLNYNSYSIGIIPKTLLDYFKLSNGINYLCNN